MPAKQPAAVVQLFQRRSSPVAEVPIASHSTLPCDTEPADAISAVDLTGRPKLIIAVGEGNVGKTVLARWLVETSLRRGAEPPILAALDTNRSLAQYFENVAEPDGNYEAAKVTLLDALIQHAMTEPKPPERGMPAEPRRSVVLDLGGNDTSLGHVVSAFPGLVDTLEDAGVSPVLLYVLSPRVYDLTALSTLEAAGFRPRATAIVLNEGVADVTRGRAAFDAVLAHSVYRAAVARGVVPLWMPRLEPAQEIELARIHFSRAAGGLSQEQREPSPLGPLDQLRVRRWLEKMDARFGPVSSWLP